MDVVSMAAPLSSINTQDCTGTRLQNETWLHRQVEQQLVWIWHLDFSSLCATVIIGYAANKEYFNLKVMDAQSLLSCTKLNNNVFPHWPGWTMGKNLLAWTQFLFAPLEIVFIHYQLSNNSKHSFVMVVSEILSPLVLRLSSDDF